MRTAHFLAVLVVSTGILTGTAQAQGPRAPMALVVTAENLMAGDERHSAPAVTGTKATDLLSDDVLRYVLRFTNVRDDAVANVAFSNPVPKGLRYVSSSASASVAGTAITFSIDGGEHYSARPMIEVVEAGKRRTTPAPAAMYTHIRWTVPGRVRSMAEVTAEFRAELAPRVLPATQ